MQATDTALLSEAEKFVLDMAEEEAAALPPLPPAAAEAPELQAQLAALKAQVRCVVLVEMCTARALRACPWMLPCT